MGGSVVGWAVVGGLDVVGGSGEGAVVVESAAVVVCGGAVVDVDDGGSVEGGSVVGSDSAPDRSESALRSRDSSGSKLGSAELAESANAPG